MKAHRIISLLSSNPIGFGSKRLIPFDPLTPKPITFQDRKDLENRILEKGIYERMACVSEHVDIIM